MRRTACCLLLSGLLALAACDEPPAQGDANAVIIAAGTDLWAEVGEDFRDRMEPTIQTVREERPFRITQLDPANDQGWGQVRRFRQVVAVGAEEDPWVAEALEELDDAPAAPAIAEVEDVWARGQLVRVVLLPEGNAGEAALELADEVFAELHDDYLDYVRSRMYTSGRDTLLADSLAQNVGFALRLPEVYDYTVTDDVFRFRNDNPSPRELIREIAVTWVEPAPDEDPSREELEEWRSELAREHYVDPQDLDTTVVSYEPIEVNGAEGVEFRSAWVSPPDAWPAGGPFITRALRCPDQDRVYLMDAWVYAPDRDKYEYVLQIETILESFQCASGGGGEDGG